MVREAADRIVETGLGIKAATITPGDPDDVGSPMRYYVILLMVKLY